MKIDKYSFHDGIPLNYHEVEDITQKVIDKMVGNPDTLTYRISTGNTIIIGLRTKGQTNFEIIQCTNGYIEIKVKV